MRIADLSRFAHVFWIDASSRVTAEQSYKEIAAQQSLGGSSNGNHVAAVLGWLSAPGAEWLLLFDNCESEDSRDGLVPSGDHGNILYTSRNLGLSLPFPKEADFEVTQMESDDAITLLLKAAKRDNTDKDLRQHAKPVVDVLGCLPLALDIAGASICMGRYRLDDYAEMFDNHRAEMMKGSDFERASKINKGVGRNF